MSTSSIAFDAFDPTIEEKIFVAAKRVCIVFAVAALGLSALDLMNVRAVEAAAEFVHDRNNVFATMQQDLQDFSLPFGTREPVAQLAAVRHQDALQAAMSARADDSMPTAGVAGAPAAPVRLASIDVASVPNEATPAVLETPSISLPATLALLPPPAPGVPPPSPIERLHLEGKSLARAERCLANAIYFEARDQPFKGQVAVAQVVMNPSAPRRTITRSMCTRTGCTRCTSWCATASTRSIARSPGATAQTSRSGRSWR